MSHSCENLVGETGGGERAAHADDIGHRTTVAIVDRGIAVARRCNTRFTALQRVARRCNALYGVATRCTALHGAGPLDNWHFPLLRSLQNYVSPDLSPYVSEKLLCARSAPRLPLPCSSAVIG